MVGYDRWGDLDERQWHDTQQVCVNGHIITNYAESQPESKRSHCSACGAQTFIACQSCGAKLRGYEHVPGVVYVSASEVDRNCPDCGKPHPWTAAKQDAVVEWLSVIDSLTDAGKEEVRNLLPDIFCSTARSELALFRLKKLVGEVEAEARGPFLASIKAAADPALSLRL